MKFDKCIIFKFMLNLLLFLYFISSIYFVRPGFFLGDTAFQYIEYKNIVSYADWQPPIMNIWWSLFGDASSPFLSHLTIYVLSIFIFLNILLVDKHYKSALLMFIFLMNPLISLSVFNVLKDTGMNASLLLASSVLYAYHMGKISSKITMLTLIPVFIYITGVRQNGLFAAMPLIFFLLINSYKNAANIKAKLLFMWKYFLFIFMLIIVNNWITYSFYNATKSHPESILMKTDLAAVECLTHHAYKIPIEVFADNTDRNESMNRDNLCQKFSFETSDPLFWWTPENRTPPFTGGVTSEQQYHIIRTQWLNTIPKNINTYLYYRSMVSLNALKVNNWYIGPSYNNDYDVNIGMNNQSSYLVIKKIFDWSVKLIPNYFGLYIMILSFITLCVFTISKYKDRFKVSLILSGLLYQLMWFFLLPVPDYRYLLWFYISVILATILPIKVISND